MWIHAQVAQKNLEWYLLLTTTTTFMAFFFLNWPLVAIRSRAVVREGSKGALASPDFGVSEKRTSFCLSLYHYQPPQILKPNDRSEKRG